MASEDDNINPTTSTKATAASAFSKEEKEEEERSFRPGALTEVVAKELEEQRKEANIDDDLSNADTTSKSDTTSNGHKANIDRNNHSKDSTNDSSKKSKNSLIQAEESLGSSSSLPDNETLCKKEGAENTRKKKAETVIPLPTSQPCVENTIAESNNSNEIESTEMSSTTPLVIKGARDNPILPMPPSSTPNSQSNFQHTPRSSSSSSISHSQQQHQHQQGRFNAHSSPASNSRAQTESSPSNQQQTQEQRQSLPTSPPPTSQYQSLRHHLPKPKSPSHCSLFCAFYAEFDDIVGPKICFQSPNQFMDQDMNVSTQIIHDLLKQTFDALVPTTDPPPQTSSEKTPPKNDSVWSDEKMKNDDDEKGKKMGIHSKTASPSKDKDPTTKHEQQQSKTHPIDHTKRDNLTSSVNEKGKTSSSQVQKQQSNSNNQVTTLENPNDNNTPSFLSIFDSTSEYIITGNEIANKMMCVSTHNMHILTRPTIIYHTRYQRNSLLFSVGFVIRRVEDPRPYRPLLSKLASTLRDMEVESQFLSNKVTRFRIQGILEDILVSLNSPSSSSHNGGGSSSRSLSSTKTTSAECNLLLNDANALNLKLFRTPRPPSSPVPDHVVPVLLRPEWQLHAYDWDLAINWIVPHVDGIKYARLIAQSSDVDIEIVRACLRVLKHHGVMAFVDIFRYSNVYESTPLASAMLAGKMPKLLNQAFYFASKTANHDVLPYGTYASSSNFLDSSLHSQNNQNQDYNHQQHQEQHLSSSAPRSSYLVMPQQISTSASSFPPRSMSSGGGGGSSSGGGGYSPITAPLPSVPTSAAARREHKIMKVALAHIFCGCNRDTSFGDMLIAKVMQNAKNNAKNTEPSSTPPHHHHVDSSVNISVANRQSKSSGRHIHYQHQQRQHARSQHPSYHQPSSKYEHSDSGGSLSASEVPVATQSPSAGATAASSDKKKNDIEVDWGETFDYFDHRRLVTFGIIYGLIRRVHTYPFAFDDNDDDSCLALGVEHPMDETPPAGGIPSSLQLTSSEEPRINGSGMGSKNQHGTNVGREDHQRHRHHMHPSGTSPRLEAINGSPTAPSPSTPNQSATSTSLQPGSGSSGSGGKNEQEQTKTVPTNASSVAPPPLPMPPSVAAKHQQEQSTEIEGLCRLARVVAESMDGTKCDDELSCMYQMSLPELIDLVKRFGRKSVMSITSTTSPGGHR